MKVKVAITAIVVLAMSGILAPGESSLPPSENQAPAAPARAFAGKDARSLPRGARLPAQLAPVTLRERVDGMRSTLSKMHGLLDLMRARAASNPKNTLAKANVDMWELMVGQLDQELKELQVAMVEREAVESRRAALFKQADAKADAEAEAARKRLMNPQPSSGGAGGPVQPPPASSPK